MASTPEEMRLSMIGNLKEKTGKDLAAWLKIAEASASEKHGQLVKLLKSEHSVTHGFANLIAHEHFSAGKASSEEDLVAAQYSGAKEPLRPIYEALIATATKLGKDMEISPKKTYVSLRRKKQFAIIQPSTKTRVDLGLNMKGEPTTERLEASGSFNAMVSHRVRLSSTDDVDTDIKTWLAKAFEAAG